jgi:hypothetical protein
MIFFAGRMSSIMRLFPLILARVAVLPHVVGVGLQFNSSNQQQSLSLNDVHQSQFNSSNQQQRSQISSKVLDEQQQQSLTQQQNYQIVQEKHQNTQRYQRNFRSSRLRRATSRGDNSYQTGRPSCSLERGVPCHVYGGSKFVDSNTEGDQKNFKSDKLKSETDGDQKNFKIDKLKSERDSGNYIESPGEKVQEKVSECCNIARCNIAQCTRMKNQNRTLSLSSINVGTKFKRFSQCSECCARRNANHGISAMESAKQPLGSVNELGNNLVPQLNHQQPYDRHPGNDQRDSSDLLIQPNTNKSKGNRNARDTLTSKMLSLKVRDDRQHNDDSQEDDTIDVIKQNDQSVDSIIKQNDQTIDVVERNEVFDTNTNRVNSDVNKVDNINFNKKNFHSLDNNMSMTFDDDDRSGDEQSGDNHSGSSCVQEENKVKAHDTLQRQRRNKNNMSMNNVEGNRNIASSGITNTYIAGMNNSILSSGVNSSSNVDNSVLSSDTSSIANTNRSIQGPAAANHYVESVFIGGDRPITTEALVTDVTTEALITDVEESSNNLNLNFSKLNLGDDNESGPRQQEDQIKSGDNDYHDDNESGLRQQEDQIKSGDLNDYHSDFINSNINQQDNSNINQQDNSNNQQHNSNNQQDINNGNVARTNNSKSQVFSFLRPNKKKDAESTAKTLTKTTKTLEALRELNLAQLSEDLVQLSDTISAKLKNCKFGSEVGIEKFRKNLEGILQEFHKNPMYFC